jgi:hypothetical protein
MPPKSKTKKSSKGYVEKDILSSDDEDEMDLEAALAILER